jgi:hypothetical protein
MSTNLPTSMNEGQQLKIKEFWSKFLVHLPQHREVFWLTVAPHKPESVMVRFLRARKWDVDKALDMFLKSLLWRKNFDTQKIVDDGEPAQLDYLKRSNLALVHKVDNHQRPIVYIRTGLYDKSKFGLEASKNYCVYTMELLKDYFVRDPVETVALIMDLADFKYANFDLQFIKFLIKCLEADYPESLGALYIVDAPFFFSGIWAIVQPLLDPVVVAKIKFVKRDDLQKYIEPVSLLRKYNGHDDDNAHYPWIEPQVKQIDLNAKLEAESQLFTVGDKYAALMDRYIKGENVQHERDSLYQEFFGAWKELQKHRHDTNYHRLGLINEQLLLVKTHVLVKNNS